MSPWYWPFRILIQDSGDGVNRKLPNRHRWASSWGKTLTLLLLSHGISCIERSSFDENTSRMAIASNGWSHGRRHCAPINKRLEDSKDGRFFFPNLQWLISSYIDRYATSQSYWTSYFVQTIVITFWALILRKVVTFVNWLNVSAVHETLPSSIDIACSWIEFPQQVSMCPRLIVVRLLIVDKFIYRRHEYH